MFDVRGDARQFRDREMDVIVIIVLTVPRK